MEYLFAVEARNWVGIGTKSSQFVLEIPYLADPNLSILYDEGITEPIVGAVTATVTIDVLNQAGE